MESLGRIVTGIAHEFNNILASILGYTDLAKVYVESASQSDACKCLNQVEKAGQRCAGLIKGMLSYTGDAGLNVDKTIEPVNVAEVVSDVLTVFQLNLPDNIQIITTLNDLRSVRIDATESVSVVTEYTFECQRRHWIRPRYDHCHVAVLCFAALVLIMQ
jgi:signal transduction histidine kinase